MKLLLKTIEREKTKLEFINGRELEVDYNGPNELLLIDEELKIVVDSNEVYNAISKYSDHVYELYKEYYNKKIDKEYTEFELYLHEKINSILKPQ